MSYDVVERLPDGRERVLAAGLTLAAALAYPTAGRWAVTLRANRT